MKLRIRGNSIRLRLTRGEVDQLLAHGAVRERTRLPAGAGFGYALTVDADGRAANATLEGGVLAVTVPRPDAAAWAGSEEVAIRALLPVGDETLTILVEKDFPCLTVRPGEDDSDAFARDRLKAGG